MKWCPLRVSYDTLLQRFTKIHIKQTKNPDWKLAIGELNVYSIIQEGPTNLYLDWNARVTTDVFVFSNVVMNIDFFFVHVSRIRLFFWLTRGEMDTVNGSLRWRWGEQPLQDSWGTTSIIFWHITVDETAQKKKIL